MISSPGSKLWPIIVLSIGGGWFVLNMFLLIVLAGVATPVSLAGVMGYWLLAFTGPVALILGSALTLHGRFRRTGAAITALGCALLTAVVAYVSVIGTRRTPLSPPPQYALYCLLILATVAADLAAYKISRAYLTFSTPNSSV